MENFKRDDSFKMPDEPSAGLRVALHDLILCEDHPNYKINMRSWHKPDRLFGRLCEVCFGGAVLARLENNPRRLVVSSDYSDVGERKIVAMDYFRKSLVVTGTRIYLGLDVLGDELCAELADIHGDEIWVCYEDDPEKFKKNLFLIADKLEAMGL